MDTILTSELSVLLSDQYRLRDFTLLRILQTRGERQTLLLGTPAGKLVVKLTHSCRDENTVAAETGILAHLARYAFPSPLPLSTCDGRLYVPFGDRFVTIYKYLEGTHPLPDDAFFTELGRLLARLHSLPTAGFERPSAYRPAAILGVARDFLSGVSNSIHRSAVGELLQIIAHFPSFEDLPLGFIHTDPCYDNLLITSDGSLLLIDWDDSGITYPLLDVAYVVAFLCTFLPWDRELLKVPGEGRVTWRPDWAHRFLQAYHDTRPLNASEKACFRAAIHLNFLVYIRDWETNSFIYDNYLRMKMVESFTDPVLE